MLKKGEDSLEVKVAKTEEEKEKIFRFRYEVYVKEMGRPCYADHKNEMIRDSFDKTAHNLYIESKGNICATARVNFKKESNLEFEKEYKIDQFYPYYPGSVSEISKFIVEKTKRDRRIAIFFTKELYSFGVEKGSKIDFINCNEPLDKFYEKMGYRRYQENFEHPEYGSVVPMVILLQDISHLEKIDSPLYKVAKGMGIEKDYGVEEIKSKFNLYNVHINKKKN